MPSVLAQKPRLPLQALNGQALRPKQVKRALKRAAWITLAAPFVYHAMQRLQGPQVPSPTLWEPTCRAAQNSMASLCALTASAPEIPFETWGLPRTNITDVCDIIAERDCTSSAKVIVHDAVAYAETLSIGEPVREQSQVMEDAIEAAMRDDVAIIGETHFTPAAVAFRSQAQVLAQRIDAIVLVEGKFFGHWFAGQAATHGPVAGTVRQPDAKTYSPGYFGGLEVADTRVLGLSVYALAGGDPLGAERLMSELRMVASAPGAEVVMSLLAKLSTRDRRDIGARLAGQMLRLAQAPAADVETLRTKAAKFSPRVWEQFLTSFVDALDRVVATRSGMAFMHQANAFDGTPAQRAYVKQAARLEWPRDASFAESIRAVRTQYPRRPVIAFMGSAHAANVRRRLDEMRS